MEQLNVLGESLQLYCTGTGFQRNGFCEVPFGDHGNHSVCAIVTDEFLLMQQRIGNDLITPIPAYQFNGLKATKSRRPSSRRMRGKAPGSPRTAWRR